MCVADERLTVLRKTKKTSASKAKQTTKMMSKVFCCLRFILLFSSPLIQQLQSFAKFPKTPMEAEQLQLSLSKVQRKTKKARGVEKVASFWIRTHEIEALEKGIIDFIILFHGIVASPLFQSPFPKVHRTVHTQPCPLRANKGLLR